MKRQRLDWERVVSQVKAPPPPNDAPVAPAGLAERVLASWTVLRHDEQVRRWVRWSVGAALAAGVIVALAVAWNRYREKPILLTPPETPLLQPQFPAR